MSVLLIKQTLHIKQIPVNLFDRTELTESISQPPLLREWAKPHGLVAAVAAAAAAATDAWRPPPSRQIEFLIIDPSPCGGCDGCPIVVVVVVVSPPTLISDPFSEGADRSPPRVCACVS